MRENDAVWPYDHHQEKEKKKEYVRHCIHGFGSTTIINNTEDDSLLILPFVVVFVLIPRAQSLCIPCRNRTHRCTHTRTHYRSSRASLTFPAQHFRAGLDMHGVFRLGTGSMHTCVYMVHITQIMTSQSVSRLRPFESYTHTCSVRDNRRFSCMYHIHA